ncbi:hypothetical protein [Aeromonas veronii]|uniref:hypothetical protein n=1 Tax=Aeromonas veronii TaxID=654 RepID=UPI003D203E14
MYRAFKFLILFIPNCLLAATINVTADYKPASYEVGGGRFISTTKCNKSSSQIWLPQCKGGINELDNLLFSINMSISRSASANIKQPKNSFFYVGSSGKRNITLTSGEGKQFSVIFEPTLLGAFFYAPVPDIAAKPIYDWLAHPVGGCNYINKSVLGHTTWFDWILLWGGISERSCHTTVSYNVNVDVKSILYGFKIIPPSPLSLPNGVYKGTITLSVGPDGDISLGNGNYRDRQLIINLTLTVRHQLKVQFSEMGSTVALAPPGGWYNWLNMGNKRTLLLQKTLPFDIWASAPFKITLHCQYMENENCALKNTRDHQVTLDTKYVESKGKSYSLSTKPSIIDVEAGRPVIQEKRSIHFEIKGNPINEMLDYPGSLYQGTVTLIFDAGI